MTTTTTNTTTRDHKERTMIMSRYFSLDRLYSQSARLDNRLFALKTARHHMEERGLHSSDLDSRISELEAKQENILRHAGFLD